MSLAHGRRGRLLLLALSTLVGCEACGSSSDTIPLPPPWPPSGSGDLQVELRIPDDPDRRPPSASATREPIPGDVPGVQARDGELAGLYFIEVVLGDADLEAELPLVVLLHGRADRPRVPGGPFGGIDRPIRVLLPRGPDPLGNGYAWLPVRVGEGKTELLSRSLLQMAARLARLVEEFTATRATVGEPIVAGFSQGGLLSFALAVHHPELFSAAFPLAAWLPPPLMPEAVREAHPPIASMHGIDDAIIPIGPSREAIERLRAMGMDVTWVELEGVGHVMTEEMNALFRQWLAEALGRIAPPLEPAGADG